MAREGLSLSPRSCHLGRLNGLVGLGLSGKILGAVGNLGSHHTISILFQYSPSFPGSLIEPSQS